MKRNSCAVSPAVRVALLLIPAILSGCGGGDSGSADTGAQSWSVQLVNATGNCLRPNALLALSVVATSQTGQPIANPAFTVTASPTDAIGVDGMGRRVVRGEGAMQLTVTYTGPRTAGASIVPQILPLVRDGTAPVISVVSPARGAILQTSQDDSPILVEGEVTDTLSPVRLVRLNGEDVTVAGTSQQELLAEPTAAHWGSNFVQVIAADACGNTSADSRSFLQSASFLPAAMSPDPAARVTGASALRITQGAIDDSDRTDFDDLATLAERLAQTALKAPLDAAMAQVSSFTVNGTTEILGVDVGCTMTVNPGNSVNWDSGWPRLTAQLNATGGAIRFTADLRNLRVAASYHAVCKGVLGNELFNQTATFAHSIGRLFGTIVVRPTISNGALAVAIDSVQLQMTDAAVDSQTNPVLASLINAAAPALLGSLNPVVSDLVESQLSPLLSELVDAALERMARPTLLPLPPPLNRPLLLAATFGSVGITTQDLSLSLNQQVYPAAALAPNPSPLGAIFTALTPRALGGAAGSMSFALNDNAVNQVLWALWKGGALQIGDVQDHVTNLLANLPDTPAPDLSGVTLDLSAQLPPVVERAVDSGRLVLGIGDVRFSGSIDLAQNAHLPGTGVVTFDAYAGVRADAWAGVDPDGNTIDMELNDVDAEYYLHASSLLLNGEPWSDYAAMADVEALLADLTEPLLRGILANVARQLPLADPVLDLPTAFFGPGAGLVLDVIAMSRDQDRFVLTIDPDEIPGPPPAGINWAALATVAITAARNEAAARLAAAEPQCSIKGSKVSGKVYVDAGKMAGNAIKEALLQAGAPPAVARGWSQAFLTAWMQWAKSLALPDLAVFPEFAADADLDIQQTSTEKQIPMQLLRWKQDATLQSALLQQLNSRLKEFKNQPGAATAFDTFAAAISAAFADQMARGTITVTGKAAYRKIGAKAAGEAKKLVSPAELKEVKKGGTPPQPPAKGPVAGHCEKGGRFDAPGFSS